jgi:pilus assembly protein Flp/PilA
MFDYVMAWIATSLTSLKTDRRGVTAMEYGLIAGLIAVVIVAALTIVGGDLRTIFETIGNRLGNVPR